MESYREIKLLGDGQPTHVRRSKCPINFAQVAALACMQLLLAACAHSPTALSGCEVYGIRDDNNPMGKRVHIPGVFWAGLKLETRCLDVTETIALVNPDEHLPASDSQGR